MSCSVAARRLAIVSAPISAPPPPTAPNAAKSAAPLSKVIRARSGVVTVVFSASVPTTAIEASGNRTSALRIAYRSPSRTWPRARAERSVARISDSRIIPTAMTVARNDAALT